MDPVLCLSSRMTTELLELRNPQGAEANWLDRPEDRGSIGVFVGRVVVSELGCALLMVTATIETVAYGTLGLVALCFWYVNPDPAKHFGNLIASSGFTMLWNLGNITVFSPGCTNCVTHESFARYSMDNWDRGQVFKLVLLVAEAVLNVLSRNRTSGLLLSAAIIRHKFTRIEDSLHIANWTMQHRIAPAVAGGGGQHAIPAAVANPQLRIIRQHGNEMNARIAAGTAFIRDHILAEGQVDGATRRGIREYDPAAMLFMLSRAVYLYSYGELRDQLIPDFFAPRTRVAIRQLRDRPAVEGLETNLNAFMGGMEAYNRGPENLAQRELFTEIKGIGYADQQGGLLMGRCLQDAVQAA